MHPPPAVEASEHTAGEASRLALRTALLYALFGGIWILSSDAVLMAFARTPERFARLSVFKGWAFVLTTAALLYGVLRRSLARWQREVSRRREAEAAQQEEAARTREYVAHAPIGMFVVDDAGRFLDANPMGIAMLRERAEVLSQRAVFDYVAAHDLADARMRHAAFVERGRCEGEVSVVRADGTPAWMHLRAVRLDDERCLAFAYDITDRKRLEAQFLQAQKMEAIGTLAGGIAHDFNNLLTVILGSASLLKLPGLDESEVHENTSQILEAAERASGLTRQLLLFSRKQTIRPRATDLNLVVTNLARMLRRIVGEDVSFEVCCADPLPTVHGDAGLLEQALMNLSVNARDAMPGGGQLTVRTALVELTAADASEIPDATPGPWVVLEVSDTGVGIHPAVLPHILEPFFTTKDAGHGTGLGLTTVYGIVKQHHGWLAVTSKPGAGTTFRLGLPPLDVDARAHTPAPDALRAGTGAVLVVEDDAAVRSNIVRTLRRCGYTVHEAASGREALARCAQLSPPPALLLTDLVMPAHVDGVALAAQLRARTPGLRVLFTSGYDHAAQCPPNAPFLQKPFSPARLSDAVHAALLAPSTH